MSSSTPSDGEQPNPQWGQQSGQQSGWGTAPADQQQVSFGPGEPSGPSGPAGPGGSRGRRRGLQALVLAVVIAVLMGGGAYAFYAADPLHLFRAGPQAAEAVPADAVLYVGVDLDPSALQKINALRFLNHFPSFRNQAHLQDVNVDVRKSVFDQATRASPCRSVTYDRDIAPWIGTTFGFAMVPTTPGGTQTEQETVIQVTDASAAIASLKRLQACSGAGLSHYGYATTGDYLVLAKSQPVADDLARRATTTSLASNADFTADMGSLGDLGVATFWANLSPLEQSLQDYLHQTTGQPMGPLGTGDGGQRVAGTVRFASNRLELALSSYTELPVVGHAANEIVKLPGTTVLAASLSGGGPRLQQTWPRILSQLKQRGQDLTPQIRQLESQTGLRLPDDLATLLGNNVLFAVDSTGLTADALRNDPGSLQLGARFTNDPHLLDAIYTKLVSAVTRTSGANPALHKTEFDNGIALATSDTYAKTLAELNGDLGSSPDFASVIPDGASPAFVFYFDWNAVEPQVLGALQQPGVPQTLLENSNRCARSASRSASPGPTHRAC